MLTPMLPVGASYRNFRAAAPLVVKIDAAFPYGLAAMISIASSRLPASRSDRTGPKISVVVSLLAAAIPLMTVGFRKWPALHRRDPRDLVGVLMQELLEMKEVLNPFLRRRSPPLREGSRGRVDRCGDLRLFG
jgi:hypothetical protein